MLFVGRCAKIAWLPFGREFSTHGGEKGGAVVAGNHGEAGGAHDLGRGCGVAGAGGAENGDHARIGDDAQRRVGTAFGTTARILDNQLHRMAEKPVAALRQSQLQAAHLFGSQHRDLAAERLDDAQAHGSPGCDIHTA